MPGRGQGGAFPLCPDPRRGDSGVELVGSPAASAAGHDRLYICMLALPGAIQISALSMQVCGVVCCCVNVHKAIATQLAPPP